MTAQGRVRMRAMQLTAAAVVAAWTSWPRVAAACTTVAIPKSPEKWVGKSYDWHSGLGMVVTNKRHVRKTGLALFPQDVAPSWTSRYGSLTFNQYGREFPNGGINERGLVVELMWLDSSVYPPPSSQPSLNELQWIQYQLDNYATVAEAVAAAASVRISKVYAAVHYMACDRTGACATFEAIGGKMQVHTGAELPATALTNDTYAKSLAYWRSATASGTLPKGADSLPRFARAASAAAAYPPATASEPGYVFSILRDVSQGSYSKWNIVYASTTGHVSFRTLTAPTIKELDAAAFDYSCKTPSLVLDIDYQVTTAATSVQAAFRPYTEGVNRRLIEAELKQLPVQFPSAMVDLWAHYPATTRCSED